MAEEPLQLRPMTTADIIDTAIRLYRHNFVLFLGISAVVQLPALLAQVVSAGAISRAAVSGDELDMVQFAGIFSGVGVMGLAAIVLYPLGQAAMTLAVSERYLGRATSVRAAYAAAVPYWGRVLWTSILCWLAIYGGMFACFIPGLWLGIRLLLAPSVTVVLEGRWGSDGLSRSWRLTERFFWSILGTMSVLMLMVLVATYGLLTPVTLLLAGRMASDPAAMVTYQIITQSIASTMQIILGPLWMLGMVLVYYDLRIRKEGFDLLMMAQALGVPAPAGAVSELPAPLYPAADPGPEGMPPAKPPQWAPPPVVPLPSQAQPLYPTASPQGPPAAPPLDQPPAPQPPAPPTPDAPPPLYPTAPPPKPPGDSTDA
jgi:hypothetical protein